MKLNEFLIEMRADEKIGVISFPPRYRPFLIKGTKNITVRTDQEIGRYHVGKIYECRSNNSDRTWGIFVKITDKKKMTLKELANSKEKYKVDYHALNPMRKSKGLDWNDHAEVLFFEVVKVEDKKGNIVK